MVDEYQDLSPVNHALLAKLVTGRLIGVGDPWQNIYGFRGASAGGMGAATAQYKMVSFPLSTSFRCPSRIVDHVRWRVPNFKAFRSGGSVSVPEHLDAGLIRPDATIICRNNAPLLACAFKLLRAGHSVSVAGTDIGPRVVALMRKLGPESLSRTQALDAIANWEAEKLANESKTAADMAECMRVFVGHGDGLGSAIAYAEHLFKQDGSIRLMTGHKSKGLEFDDVIHLDPWLCRETEQDKNLRYVISTRSRDRLTEIDSGAIRW
jgi:ATP-dependent exoDNAse (exonuclease V) beta subunit